MEVQDASSLPNNKEDLPNTYVVEEILERCKVTGADGRKNESYLYHIKWYGYAETTWEPYENVTNCHEKLKEFKRSLKNN